MIKSFIVGGILALFALGFLHTQDRPVHKSYPPSNAMNWFW